MAFVNKADRKIGHINITTAENIGPGSYIQPKDYQQQQKSCVPFNVSEPRETKFLKSKDSSPGPGHYQVMKNNNNEKVVVSSANEDIKIVEVPKPQSVFKSNTKRFVKPGSADLPGPGHYVNINQFMLQKQQQLQQKQKQSMIEKLIQMNRYQSIPSIPSNLHSFGYTENEHNDLELNKMPMQTHTGLGKDHVGPGQYELKDTFEINQNKAPHWSKYRQKKLINTKPTTGVLGPGAYDVQNPQLPLYKTKQSSGFASRTMRQMDNRKGAIANQFIKQRSVQSQDGQKRQNHFSMYDEDTDDEYEYIEDTTPGPGYYEAQKVVSAIKTQQIKPEKYQFFGSSQDRFKDKKPISGVGPGDYANDKAAVIGQKNNIKVKNPPFLSSNTRFEMTSLTNKLGPGQYEFKNTLEDKLINKIQKGYRGNFGTTEMRFKYMNMVDEMPGPGTYLDPIPEKATEEIQSNAVFKSKNPRQAFKAGKEAAPPVGAYNVNFFDIQKQVIKEEEDDPDLAIKKPGFNSSQPRFIQSKNKDANLEEDEDETVSFTKDKNISDLFKKKPNKAAPFNTKQKRFPASVSKEHKPGPGQYHDPTSNPWNKRTYNILFAEI